MKHYGQFYIDGQWVDPVSSTRTFELVNPATEATFATIALGSAEDVDRAVKAARQAFLPFRPRVRPNASQCSSGSSKALRRGKVS